MKSSGTDTIREPPVKPSIDAEVSSTPRTHMFLPPELMIDYFFPIICYFLTSPILPFLPFLGQGFLLAQLNPQALPAHIQLGLLSALAGTLLALVTPNSLAFLGWANQLIKKDKVQLQTSWATLFSFTELITYLLVITYVGTWLAHNISLTLFQAFGVGGIAFISTIAIERITLLGTLLGTIRQKGKQITFQKIRIEAQKRATRLELQLTLRT